VSGNERIPHGICSKEANVLYASNTLQVQSV